MSMASYDLALHLLRPGRPHEGEQDKWLSLRVYRFPCLPTLTGPTGHRSEGRGRTLTGHACTRTKEARAMTVTIHASARGRHKESGSRCSRVRIPTAASSMRPGSVLLVGDSVGRNVLGYADELRSRWRDAPSHPSGHARSPNAMVVETCPSCRSKPPWKTRRNAGRFLKEAGAHAVKIEGLSSEPSTG